MAVTRKRGRLSESVKAERRLRRRLASDSAFRAEYYRAAEERIRKELRKAAGSPSFIKAAELAKRFVHTIRALKFLGRLGGPSPAQLAELRKLNPDAMAAGFSRMRRGAEAARSYEVFPGEGSLSDEQIEEAFAQPESLALKAAILHARHDGGLGSPQEFAKTVGLAMGLTDFTPEDLARVFSPQEIRDAIYDSHEPEPMDDDDVESVLARESERRRDRELVEEDHRITLRKSR